MLTSSTQACLVHQHHPPKTPLPGVLEDPVLWSWMLDALRELSRQKLQSLEVEIRGAKSTWHSRGKCLQSGKHTTISHLDVCYRIGFQLRRTRRAVTTLRVGLGCAGLGTISLLGWLSNAQPVYIAWMGLGGCYKGLSPGLSYPHCFSLYCTRILALRPIIFRSLLTGSLKES